MLNTSLNKERFKNLNKPKTPIENAGKTIEKRTQGKSTKNFNTVMESKLKGVSQL
jgi:hypothetical protein